MRSCNWSCRLGLLTKDAVLAQERAWRDRAQTGPSMRSAGVSEDKRPIMGQRCGVRAPSLTSSDALLKGSYEHRDTLTQCDPFGIPSRHVGRVRRSSGNESPTKTCIVTWKTSPKPMPSLWPGDVRNEMMEAAWRLSTRTVAMPDWTEPFARTIDAAKKYVVSSTLDRVDWNVELVRGDLGQTVQGRPRTLWST